MFRSYLFGNDLSLNISTLLSACVPYNLSDTTDTSDYSVINMNHNVEETNGTLENTGSLSEVDVDDSSGDLSQYVRRRYT